MNVTGRRLLLLLSVVSSVFLTAIAAWHYYTDRSAADLYARTKQHDAVLVERMLKLDGGRLAIYASDYSYWDEMVAFVEKPSPRWARNNLEESMGSYGAHAVAVYDSDGAVVYSSSVEDYPGLQVLSLDPEAVRSLFFQNAFCHFYTETSCGLLEVRGAKIVPSDDVDRRTPARGYWFVSRLWDSRHLSELGMLFGGRVSVMRPEAARHKSQDEVALRTMVFRQPLFGPDRICLRTLCVAREFKEIAAQRASAAGIMKILVVFAAALLIALSVFLSLWIARPVGLLSRAMESGSPKILDRLEHERTEFGQLAILLSSFFRQKALLEQEVRDRMLAEEALRESEQRFRTIYESSHDAMMLLDENGILDCNVRTLEMFGIEREEDLISLHPADVSPPYQPDGRDSLPAARANIEMALKDGACTFEWVHRSRNGEDFPAEVLLSALEINGKRILQSTVRDITERVEMQSKIATERERLATTLRSIGDGVIAVDMNGNVSMLNPVAEHLTGWDRVSAVGRSFREVFHAVDKTTRERIECPVQTVMRTGEPLELANHTMLISRDGSERCIADSCAPIYDDSRAMTGVVLVFRDETDRKRAQDAIIEERDKAQRYLDVAANLFVALDTQGSVVLVNGKAADMLGYEPSELIGRNWFDTVIPEDQRDKVKQVFADLVSGSGEVPEFYENAIVTKDGECKIIEWHNVCLRDAAGNITGTLSSGEDVTERVHAERLIRLQSAAIDAADDLIAILDLEGRIVFANEAFGKQTGYRMEELLGKSLSLLRPQRGTGTYDEDAWALVTSGQAWNGEMQCRSCDGSEFTADVAITPLTDPTGRAEHLIAIARNITDRKEYEGLLDYQAHHDALTDLPNRTLFCEEVESAMQRHRKKRKRLAVLFIDLDKFKMVNDTMGHQAGDAVLVESAARLAACLRKGDTLARLGGDEFTALLQNLNSFEDARAVAGRMLNQFSAAFNVENNRLVISASIGVAMYPENSSDVNSLLASADAAMYRAKELGRNNFQFFSEELGQANQTRMEIESDLRQAVDRDELEVYYQPIIDLRSMQITGAEALIRWNHPGKGMISPGVFVPIAEETGLILQVGSRVLETACRQCKAWHDMGHADLEISLNVSPVQLRSTTFPSEVSDILRSTGLTPAKLNLEITESVLARNDHGEIEALGLLRQLGIMTCLDDFGIGYSSLSRLKEFPVIHMKVDGSFIKEIECSVHDKAMTGSIVAMAHNLGIKVTAEWVESEEQMEIIRLLGCDYAQGYLISPALPPAEFIEFVHEWNALQSAADAA